MEEIWRKIEGYENYSISNKGRIRNDKTEKMLLGYNFPKSQLRYVMLMKDGERSGHLPVHKLVASHFDKMDLSHDTAVHLNYIQYDNRAPNLEGATRGEAMVRTRRNNRVRKNKLLGVYKWNYVYKNKVTPKWRAVLSLGDKKMGTKTLGYFDTRKEAKLVLHKAYLNHYGVEPFKV